VNNLLAENPQLYNLPWGNSNTYVTTILVGANYGQQAAADLQGANTVGANGVLPIAEKPWPQAGPGL
jgi:hypothetical protein